MKKRFPNACCCVALAIMVTLAGVQVSASGPGTLNGSSQGGPLEGTWQTQLTFVNCETGEPIATPPPFVSLITFMRGGSVIEQSNSLFLRSIGQGTWQHAGGQSYTSTVTFFRFGFNPSAANPFPFIGTARVTKQIELAADGNEYTATTESLFTPVSGSPTTTCLRDVAHRYE